MPAPRRNSSESEDSNIRPFTEDVDGSSLVNDINLSVKPKEFRFEDLPQLHDNQAGVRPYEIEFEYLPHLHDPQPGIRPYEVKSEQFPPVHQVISDVVPFEFGSENLPRTTHAYERSTSSETQ